MQIIEAERGTYHSLSRWSEMGASSEEYLDILSTLIPPGILSDSRWVRQGGSMPEAKEGVEQLGQELAAFIEHASLPGPWKVSLYI